MRAVNLTQRNATQVDASSARVALAPSAHPRDASGSGTVAEGTAKAAGAAPPAYLYKNPGEAVLFSFLIPGVGQMYNGQVGKGVALLLVSTAGAAVAISAAGSCNFSTDCNNTASEVLGGSVFLGAWIYSMVDAYSGAKQHNAKLGFRVGSIPIAPHIGEERNGRTTIGLSLAVR